MFVILSRLIKLLLWMSFSVQITLASVPRCSVLREIVLGPYSHEHCHEEKGADSTNPLLLDAATSCRCELIKALFVALPVLPLPGLLPPVLHASRIEPSAYSALSADWKRGPDPPYPKV